MKTVILCVLVFVMAAMVVSGSVGARQVRGTVTVTDSCLRRDSITADCVRTFWGGGGCDGRYVEDVPSPPEPCDQGWVYKKVYRCICHTTFDGYNCPSAPYVRYVDTLQRSEVRYDEGCFHTQSAHVISTISHEIATNPTLCNQWCLGKTSRIEVYLP